MMLDSANAARRALTEVRLKAAATLFICGECRTGKHRRRQLKAALKAAGRKRELRVVACRCLDVCPRRAAAAILARGDAPARPIAIGERADPAELLSLLLGDERV